MTSEYIDMESYLSNAGWTRLPHNSLLWVDPLNTESSGWWAESEAYKIQRDRDIRKPQGERK